MAAVFHRRRRRVQVAIHDAVANRWVAFDEASAVDRDHLTLATFNVWFDDYFAERRYRAIADLLCREMPDVMVFQEITPKALDVLLAQPWIQEHYRLAAVVGASVGNYGMLMLTRLPTANVTYTRLPTRLSRGFLLAEFTVNGSPLVVCSVHLDSGKRSARLRARQLRRVFRALRPVDDAAVLGDFNMRDHENPRIAPPYRDVWPMLRPNDEGFTEDTSINLMRFDSKTKHRQVRFDRVLLKGPRWAAASIELLGTQPISGSHRRVFPSDHFGVMCRLVRRSAVPTPARPRRPAVPGWLHRHS
jgi:tyrosyl-DNA phosphodiesterase 2